MKFKQLVEDAKKPKCKILLPGFLNNAKIQTFLQQASKRGRGMLKWTDPRGQTDCQTHIFAENCRYSQIRSFSRNSSIPRAQETSVLQIRFSPLKRGLRGLLACRMQHFAYNMSPLTHHSQLLKAHALQRQTCQAFLCLKPFLLVN